MEGLWICLDFKKGKQVWRPLGGVMAEEIKLENGALIKTACWGQTSPSSSLSHHATLQGKIKCFLSVWGSNTAHLMSGASLRGMKGFEAFLRRSFQPFKSPQTGREEAYCLPGTNPGACSAGVSHQVKGTPKLRQDSPGWEDPRSATLALRPPCRYWDSNFFQSSWKLLLWAVSHCWSKFQAKNQNEC
jgi:hypothetical protein